MSTVEVSKRSPWRKRVLWAGLVALLVLAGWRVAQSVMRADKAKPAPVTQIQLKASEVLTVQARDFTQTLPLSGALNPYTQATVSARASGEVAQVLVREGQSVQKGQVLAVLNDTNYQAQLTQALANEQSAVASLKLAQQDFDNNTALVKEGFISKIALQKVEVQLASARTQLQNATQAKVIAQRAMSEVQVKSPVAGVVSMRNVREGETAAIGAPLFAVVNVDAFELAAPISAEQIGLIQIGQTVQLSSAGVAEPFTGVVERINPAASNGSRSYVAYIRVPNVTGALKAGMFAQGQVVIAARQNVLSVPATALHMRDGKSFVYVVHAQKLAEQEVLTGARASDAIDAMVEVTSGVQVDDVVVRLDLGKLKVGMSVQLLNADGTVPEATAQPASKATWWQKIIGLFKS
ncbi:MAG: efflux RND transporter periplasmic adaptor subunit [Formosimonas sp.]